MHHHHHHHIPWYVWAASRGRYDYPPNSAEGKFVRYFVWYPLMAIWAAWIALFAVTAGFAVFCIGQQLLGL